jgi:hypothetical protein
MRFWKRGSRFATFIWKVGHERTARIPYRRISVKSGCVWLMHSVSVRVGMNSSASAAEDMPVSLSDVQACWAFVGFGLSYFLHVSVGW